MAVAELVEPTETKVLVVALVTFACLMALASQSPVVAVAKAVGPAVRVEPVVA
jgi:hypothetical protein